MGGNNKESCILYVSSGCRIGGGGGMRLAHLWPSGMVTGSTNPYVAFSTMWSSASTINFHFGFFRFSSRNALLLYFICGYWFIDQQAKTFEFNLLVCNDDTLVNSLLQQSVHFKYKGLSSIFLLFVSSLLHCDGVASTECRL